MGRPRKRGDRYPSGDLRPERFPPIVVKRMIDASREKVIDARFGTTFGRLRLEGKLTDAHVSAASHFANFFGFYDRVFGNRARTSKSPDYQLGRAGQGEDNEVWRCKTCDGDCTRCLVRERASDEYDAIKGSLSPAEWTAVYHAVLLNEACPWPQQVLLSQALTKLACKFGYVTSKASNVVAITAAA